MYNNFLNENVCKVPMDESHYYEGSNFINTIEFGIMIQ